MNIEIFSSAHDLIIECWQIIRAVVRYFSGMSDRTTGILGINVSCVHGFIYCFSIINVTHLSNIGYK